MDCCAQMPRYKLTIEYDGGPFCGWQLQENGPSVQGALETAVKAISGEAVRVHGAGRTDAGVHAMAQVAHCDIAKHFVPGRFRDGLNAHLRPHPIGVLSAEIVPDTFEARFSAKKRHYLYRISNRRANLALDIGRACRLPPLASARCSLHSQVRSMVGSLVWVGEGRWSADDLAAALAARDRTACGPVAPPDGVYLVKGAC